MIHNYQRLLLKSPRFFIFSISGIFFSAPGQTFLISLVIPAICNTLAISPLRFAALYSSATIMASLFLPIIGKMIDQWPLKKTILLNTTIFTAAILLFSTLSSQVILFFALFLMRLFGQGALALTATSITIKQFVKHRGSALSLTQLGYPISEFIFPGIAIFLIGSVGWRATFFLLALAVPLLYLPLSLIGLPSKPSEDSQSTESNSKSLSFVLNDGFFPIYVALSSIPPIMMTATLYFQVDIFNLNGWPIANAAVAIFCYALVKFVFTIIIGPLIDRFGVVYSLFFLIFCIGSATFLISLNGPQVMAFFVLFIIWCRIGGVRINDFLFMGTSVWH